MPTEPHLATHPLSGTHPLSRHHCNVTSARFPRPSRCPAQQLPSKLRSKMPLTADQHLNLQSNPPGRQHDTSTGFAAVRPVTTFEHASRDYPTHTLDHTHTCTTAQLSSAPEIMTHDQRVLVTRHNHQRTVHCSGIRRSRLLPALPYLFWWMIEDKVTDTCLAPLAPCVCV